MKKIIFKKCRIKDLKVLHKISLETFVESFGHDNTVENIEHYFTTVLTEEKIKKELGHKNSFFYLIKLGDSNIGYLKLNIEDAQGEPIEGALEIERIYLFSAYQGRGIGQLMMNHTFEMATSFSKTKIWLGVWSQNKGAIRFYERNGFRKFGTHSFFLGSDEQTDYLMELILQNG